MNAMLKAVSVIAVVAGVCMIAGCGEESQVDRNPTPSEFRQKSGEVLNSVSMTEGVRVTEGMC